jgi:hypothetical protein
MSDKQKNFTLIRITKESKDKIDNLAETLNLKQITVLEYLLSGKLSLEELNK